MSQRLLVFGVAVLVAGVLLAPRLLVAADKPDAAGLEFFERRIRPLLAENCYQCHGPEKQRNGLRLDSRTAILTGGDRGPSIVPEKPDESRLILAVRYGDEPRMPPKGKLSDAQIADLATWIKMGAPAPAPKEEIASSVRPSDHYDFAERRRHWSYQPVRPVAPPAVKDAAWCTSPIDRFILARLEAAGLSPSPPADRRTLIRRVTFDLTGLPPTPAEVTDYVSDTSPDAYERLVDRLLASPRYGERWGRHWLDLVRYSETLAFEFDYDLYNAWRYRDYVIRAFNDDLPFDRFVIEHLAGDLLPQPRRHPTERTNESILATGFFWMGEGKQTPIDIRQEQAERIDNQIDVLGKAFLGQTIACARCHDHKFDAISARDYYALAGYLRSSRYQQAFIDPPERIEAKARQLAALHSKIRDRVAADIVPAWINEAKNAARYLLAVRAAKTRDRAVEEVARESGVDAARLGQWMTALGDKVVNGANHPLYAWVQLTAADAPTADQVRQRLRTTEPHAANAEQFEDFGAPDYGAWSVTGDGFGAGPARGGEVVVGDRAERPIARLAFAGANSGLFSPRLQGELRSRTFTIDKRFAHFRVAGRGGRLNLVIDGYTLIMNPIYGKLTIAAADDRPTWRTMPIDRWIGQRAFIEISDSTIPVHGLNPPPSTARPPDRPDGHIVVDRILFSDDPNPPLAPNRISAEALDRAGGNAEALASAYQEIMVRELERWRAGETTNDGVGLINWLLENGLLDGPATGPLAELLSRYREIESRLPAPLRAPALADGTGEDEYVFLRGNYRTPGERARRRPPEIIAGPDPQSGNDGSGRLELARRLVDPTNPLLARVMVNRLWQHHFGEGLVRTPDDFGRMGQPPTHPELLDYLAAEFDRGGYSIKAMHRTMLLSSTYLQSSAIRQQQSDKDPENRLLHRMPVRRLEGEAIRDAILAVSGRLEQSMHGPSVLPYLTPHMEGRGRPSPGPLDGDGRRSVYINARRNFLTPMFVAFDYPTVFTTVGRRSTSTVPAQALTLMNDPFVVQQAGRWAERVLAQRDRTDEQRIADLYLTAFARPPSAEESRDAREFLARQAERYGDNRDDPRAWADLCHVLLNAKEFIFFD
jgi:mono/diheme cytochrome c family protein